MKKPVAKIWFGLIMVISLIADLDARATDSHRAETERRKLSVMFLVEGAVKGVETQSIDTQRLYDEINNNKLLHQKNADSRTLSLTQIEQKIEGNLEKSLDDIFKASALKNVDPAWCDKSKADALKRGKIRIKKNLSKNFIITFNEVRAAVVKEQEAKLEKFATPETPQDYLSVEKKSPSLHGNLLERSIKMYSEPLFSENQKFLSKKIKDIIDKAWQQYDTQRRIVNESKGVGNHDITVESIQKAIIEEIERYKKSLKNPYRTFLSVQASILQAAQQTASIKFNKWISAWHYLIDQQRIEQAIKADSVTHRHKRQSRELLKKKFSAEVQDQLFSDYFGRLSPDEQQRLREFLESQPGFDNQVAIKIDNSLNYFDTARQTVSQAQFDEKFPVLSTGAWKLDEKVVEKRHTEDTAKDNQRIVERFLKGQQVIEETDDILKEVISRLAAKGDAAIKKQMQLVDNYMKKNSLQLLEDVSDTQLGADEFIKKLVNEATVKISQSWSSNELSEDYPHLFVLVKKKIRQEIKDLIPIELERRETIRAKERKRQDELKKMEKSKSTQTDKAKDGGDTLEGGGGKHKGSGKGPGKGPDIGPGTGNGKGPGGGGGAGSSGKVNLKKIKPDAIIDIDVENGKDVRVLIQLAKTGAFSFAFALGDNDYNRYHARMTPDLKRVESRFKDYLTQKARHEGIDHIYIFARVFHVKVPYGIVFDLRESVRNVVNDLKIKEKRIWWYDGFFSNRDVPISETMRKRSSHLGTDDQ